MRPRDILLCVGCRAGEKIKSLKSVVILETQCYKPYFLCYKIIGQIKGEESFLETVSLSGKITRGLQKATLFNISK